MDILIDFDGTCVTHEFPKVGKNIGAEYVLTDLVRNGHNLILFTMRSDNNEGSYLSDAVNWFKQENIPLYGINTNPTQKYWTSSPKAYGHYMIDDSAIGVPLTNKPLLFDDEWFKGKYGQEEYGLFQTPETEKSGIITYPVERPYVDWYSVSELLFFKGLLALTQFDNIQSFICLGNQNYGK